MLPKSWSMSNLLFLCVITITVSHISCRVEKRSLGIQPASYGYNGYQIAGFGPMERYLTNKLANFSGWVKEKVPGGKIDTESSPLKFSDVAVHNRFYNLDLSFTETPRLNVITLPNCVNTDFESGKIVIRYSAYNTLHGKYKAKGTILNGTHFSGEGAWGLRFSTECILETYFTYGNGSHVTLEELPQGTDQPDGKYFQFYCSKDSTQNVYNASDPLSCQNGMVKRRVASRFPGLFNTTEGTPTGDEMGGAEALIRASLGRHLKMQMDSVDIHPPSLGSLLYQHLRDVMQENSVFKMLNFQATPRLMYAVALTEN